MTPPPGDLATLAPRSGWLGVWLRELRGNAWIVLFVPVVLTALLGVVGRDGPAELLRGFLFNTMMMLVVELVRGGLYTLVCARWIVGRGPALQWLVRGLTIIIALVVATELTVRLFAALAWISDVAATRVHVLQIAVVVAVTKAVTSTALERQHAPQSALEVREEQLRRETLRAQLSALQARTNPHFLFNALNTVASLIEDDPARAELAVERLASLFRYSLDGSHTLAVPLRAELAAVRDYVEVERLRFGERLRVEFSVEPATEALWVPPLVLQPLVENAVAHGVASRRAGATVTIGCARVGASLELTVEDDGDAAATGPSRGPSRGSGTALANLRERLHLAHGDAAQREAGPAPHGGFRARVRLPADAGPEAQP